jgi:hypothetical protein
MMGEVDMTEEMATESLVKYHWELKGYLVRTRVPYKVPKGNSDIDVLCFHPKTKKCIIVECKAWGSPEDYRTFRDTPSNWEEFEYRIKKLTNKLALKKAEEVTGVEVERAVLYTPGDVDPSFNRSLIEFAQKNSKIPIDIVPIHKLIIDLFSEIALDMRKRRTRYPDTALELIRWFDRCLINNLINLQELEAAIKKKWDEYEG